MVVQAVEAGDQIDPLGGTTLGYNTPAELDAPPAWTPDTYAAWTRSTQSPPENRVTRLPSINPGHSEVTSAGMMPPTGLTPPAYAVTPVAYADPVAPVDNQAEFYTMDELRTEMKKFAWTKGDFRIVPYGALWADAVYATDRTYPGNYTMYVPSPVVQGEDAFHISARRTRLGINIDGPPIPLFCGAKSGAKVEIDFQGKLNPTENKPGVLLRHAYWEAKSDNFRFLIGQTWDVISPLYPGTLSYPVGWWAGNIGYRRPQVRLERYWNVSDAARVVLQTSLNHSISSDGWIGDETASYPIIEGRLGTILGQRGNGARPIGVGISGHIGETGGDGFPLVDDARIRTWSINGDLRVPITERFGFQGEYFTGQNLSPFLGGIGQGVHLVGVTPRGIRSTGGWAEFWYDWSDRWHSHVGYCVDDPNDADLAGLPFPVVGRSYNEFLFANIVCDVTNNLSSGFEVGSWKTKYIGPMPAGESLVFQWTTKYGF